jgi:HlyD family secretion protein
VNDGKSPMASEVAQTLGLGKGPERGIRLWMLLAIGLLAAGSVLTWLWLSWHNGEDPQYRTEAVQRGSLAVTVTATGNLAPTNQVQVGSELSGIVQRVAVGFNDSVKVGQVLAMLDTTKLKAKVLQSKAALSSSRARLLSVQATIQETRSQLSRLQQLREISGNKAVSQHDLDTARAAMDRALADEAMAKAAVDQAQAALEADQNDLSKAAIVSPINGIVLSRNVDPGQTVAASLQAPVLFTLAEDLTRMELIVDVDEADVGQVKTGQPAEFTVDAFPDRRFPAHITQVRFGAENVDGVVTYATVLDVDNSDLTLRPGMTATAQITVRKIEDALLVPNAALRFSPPEDDKGGDAQGNSLVRSIFARGRRPARKERPEVEKDLKRQRVWILRDKQPVPVMITIGATDGLKTVVTGGEIQAGAPVVIDMVKAAP